MNTVVRICLVLAGTVSAAQAASPLPRGTPETQGVSSGALLEFVNTLDQHIEGIHSMMVLRHGHVIAEGWWTPYDAEHNHALYSLSRSFTSTAVGLAAAEGKLSITNGKRGGRRSSQARWPDSPTNRPPARSPGRQTTRA